MVENSSSPVRRLLLWWWWWAECAFSLANLRITWGPVENRAEPKNLKRLLDFGRIYHRLIQITHTFVLNRVERERVSRERRWVQAGRLRTDNKTNVK